MYHFVSAYSSLGIGLLSSLGIGLVGVALFSWIPVGMTYISIVVGALACLGTGIFILITQSTSLTVSQSGSGRSDSQHHLCSDDAFHRSIAALRSVLQEQGYQRFDSVFG